MKSQADIPPHVDRFARAICLVLALAFGAVAATAYSVDGHPVAYWLCGAGGLLFLVAGTVGPRNLRIGLLTWLPWF